jgi:putative two-component system response regulator
MDWPCLADKSDAQSETQRSHTLCANPQVGATTKEGWVMRILVAEDDSTMRRLLERLLAGWGHEPIAAATGEEAWRVLQEDDAPRLALSDWDMPGMTGVELCRKLRQNVFEHYTYVILLTARGQQSDIVDGMNTGADDYIVKPFDRLELHARVRAGERVLALETRDLVIFALAKLAESRDPDTGEHLERVRSYCRVIAQQLAGVEKFNDTVDPAFIRAIHLTSPLHDIGKVGIPDSILLKPGRLTKEEFDIMKTHAAIGAETLDAAVSQFQDARFLVMARDIAATHHERFNGCGYPAGLSGEAIPLCGRIMALADVYDALTSKRVYKDAQSHEEARFILIEESGSHFDPDVVDAFVRAEDEFVAIAESYATAEVLV